MATMYDVTKNGKTTSVNEDWLKQAEQSGYKVLGQTANTAPNTMPTTQPKLNTTTGQTWQNSLNTFKTDPKAYKTEYDRVTGLINSGEAKDMGAAKKWLGQIEGVGAKPYQLYDIKNTATADINNQLATQTQAINQSLAQAIQASQLAVGQNKQFLEEQIKKLSQQKNVAEQKAINQSARFGGLYSGGREYRLSQVDTAYTEAQENLTRDIGARNGDINSKNSLLAQQAAQQISQLQQQAPDMIRQRVQEALAQQRKNAVEDAGLTGMYNGKPTMEYQGQQFDQGVEMAELTGYLPNGTPTSAQQKELLGNEWKVAEIMGTITPVLAQMYGIPSGTPTQQAKEEAQRIAISQQNANTSSYNASTSRINSGISQQNANTSATNATNSNNNTRINQLMDVWQNTGVAPAGLESLGIQQGTPLPQEDQTENIDIGAVMKELNDIYLSENKMTGEVSVKSQDQLRNAIIGRNYPDDVTDALLLQYGLPIN
jgi:hypothetical protein